MINIIQSSFNALFFYVYFVKHSLASAQNNLNSEFIFTDQEIYKNVFYIFLNLATIGVEIPFGISTCVNSEYTNIQYDIGYKLHLLNQGMLKLFLLY